MCTLKQDGEITQSGERERDLSHKVWIHILISKADYRDTEQELLSFFLVNGVFGISNWLRKQVNAVVVNERATFRYVVQRSVPSVTDGRGSGENC